MRLYISLGVLGALALVVMIVVLGVYLKTKSLDTLKPIWDNILHWQWVKQVLYWSVISVGTISEGAFLAASLWVTINASVHSFVRLFLLEDQTKNVSKLAETTFVGVPEFILALALTTTISHIRTWIYDRKDYASLVWSILYGLPTLSFLVLSVVTVSNSMLAIDYTLPDWMIVVRGLSGYMYGFVAILYWQLGTPQEVDRLKQKDLLNDQLVEANRLLVEENDHLKATIEGQKTAFAESKARQKQLLEELQKSDDAALQAYGDECIQWLRSGVKTVLPDEIVRFTGHSKRKITNALQDNKLQSSPRNKDLILVSSLITWLKNTPPPVAKLTLVSPNDSDNDPDSLDLESVSV
jgi:hypothetical protein